MFSTLRTRFGVPGVISVIALVFALVGGAYAANNSSSGGKATASAKAKKGPRGPKGATGPAGPAGAQGPAGPAGIKGDAGANGSNGAAGPTGPTGATGAKGTTGAAGATGATGFSGFTETLPVGKTETGTWSAASAPGEEQFEFGVPISFPIPLPEPGEAFYFNSEEVEGQEFGSSGCKWETFAPATKPEATKPGTLCVFEQFGELSNASGPVFQPPGEPFEGGYGPAGAYMLFTKNATATPRQLTAVGVWAATAG
jgi:hypothetical protein